MNAGVPGRPLAGSAGRHQTSEPMRSPRTLPGDARQTDVADILTTGYGLALELEAERAACARRAERDLAAGDEAAGLAALADERRLAEAIRAMREEHRRLARLTRPPRPADAPPPHDPSPGAS